MGTLTKACMAERLHLDVGLERPDAKKLIDLFFESIIESLENGDSVKLAGFGKFELRDKAERPGRNPKTGEDALVTARRVVTFKAGRKLKHRMEKTNDGSDLQENDDE